MGNASLMVPNIITSALAFTSTNIDDLFILVLFLGTKRFKALHIFLGQYLGIFALVLISFILSFVSLVIDRNVVGLLALFPLYLGIKQLVQAWRNPDEPEKQNLDLDAGIFAVASTTIANGSDNIGVYVPLLSTQSGIEKIQFVIVFAVMVYAWCLLAKYIAGHPHVKRVLETLGHRIMPVILILLGVIILIGSGTIPWLIDAVSGQLIR